VPPRYAYWTILIDGRPTAFRARDQEELQPTVFQLKRKNADVVLKWFARGRLWDNPEQAQWAAKSLDRPREKRDRDWRPGGQHKDPRARFDKRKRKEVAGQSAKRDARPLPKPAGAQALPTPARARPLPSKPAWQGKPQTRSTNRRPWSGKPPREGQRPWSGKPRSDGQRPWSNKPKPEGQRSWSNKGPQGERRSERPWQAKPPDTKNWPRREPPARPKRDDDKK
jgi:hypothetical protein